MLSASQFSQDATKTSMVERICTPNPVALSNHVQHEKIISKIVSGYRYCSRKWKNSLKKSCPATSQLLLETLQSEIRKKSRAGHVLQASCHQCKHREYIGATPQRRICSQDFRIGQGPSSKCPQGVHKVLFYLLDCASHWNKEQQRTSSCCKT